MQYLEYFFVLKYAEQTVQENFQPDRRCLGSVEDQTGNVEYGAQLDDFDLHPEQVGGRTTPGIVQDWKNRRKVRTARGNLKRFQVL